MPKMAAAAKPAFGVKASFALPAVGLSWAFGTPEHFLAGVIACSTDVTLQGPLIPPFSEVTMIKIPDVNILQRFPVVFISPLRR